MPHNAVKWKATPGDVEEFNGQQGSPAVLYSFVDTTFSIDRADGKLYLILFHTAPMATSENGEFENINNCHACGVSLGYLSYTVEGDSIDVQQFKRNFATHGSFGKPSYTLSFINLGEGYELLRVDDRYEGMGVVSVSTRFYSYGELMLSLISKEATTGKGRKTEKGYYEFETAFAYDKKRHTITVKQTGYRIDEKSGKKIETNKTKKLVVDNNTLQF